MSGSVAAHVQKLTMSWTQDPISGPPVLYISKCGLVGAVGTGPKIEGHSYSVAA